MVSHMAYIIKYTLILCKQTIDANHKVQQITIR